MLDSLLKRLKEKRKKKIDLAKQLERQNTENKIIDALNLLKKCINEERISVKDAEKCFLKLGKATKELPEWNLLLSRFRAVASLNLENPHALVFEITADSMQMPGSVRKHVEQVVQANLMVYVVEWIPTIEFCIFPDPGEFTIRDSLCKPPILQAGWKIPNRPTVCSKNEHKSILETLELNSLKIENYSLASRSMKVIEQSQTSDKSESKEEFDFHLNPTHRLILLCLLNRDPASTVAVEIEQQLIIMNKERLNKTITNALKHLETLAAC